MCVILGIRNSIHSSTSELIHTINSIMNQNHNNFKLNIVDRSSNDGTYEFVEKYLKKVNLYEKVNLLESQHTS